MIKRLIANVFVLGGLSIGQAHALPSLATQYHADLTESYRLTNDVRALISLNGVWRIGPTETITETAPDKSETGYVLVPSSWVHPADFPITDTPHFKLGTWNGNTQWKGRKLDDYPSAWYAREFVTPPETQNRRVYLKLDRVTISGTLYLNGKLLGTQTEREDVRWDVTDRLNPVGQPNQLEVRVDALLSAMVTAYLGGDETVISKISARLRGITGDVWLIAEPTGTTLQDLFMTTSVRNHSIDFEVEVAAATGPVDVTVDVYDKATGERVKQFVETGVAPANETGTVHFSRPWTDAVLWDTDQPHLYQAVATLRAGDQTLDQTYPQDFGFREVWLNGRDVVLNGKPLHLFSYHAFPHDAFITAARKNAEREMDDMARIGFNSIQLGSEGTFTDGRSAQYYEDVLNKADRDGIPVIMPIFPVYAYGWENEGRRADWARHVENLVKKYRNHPSIIIYAMNFNYLGYGWDMNPHTWANNYQPPDQINNLGKKRVEANASVDVLKKLDDSRLIYQHASGNFGDFMTSNFYPCWPPIQELEDSLSGWHDTGTKPMVFVELSLPVYGLDLLRARAGNYMTVRFSEMLEAEYLAPTLGPRAYTLQSERYLDILSEGATTEEKASTDKYNVDQSYVWGYNLRLHEPIESGMNALRPLLLQSWRTYGLTGFSPNNARYMEYYGRQVEPWHGIIGEYTYDDYTAPGPKPLTYYLPKHDELTSVGKMTRENLKPVIAYFGGDAQSGFSSKDHAWYAGDIIKKQIVVVNDLRHDLNTTLRWRMVNDADGASVADGDVPVHVAAGTSGFIPLTIQAPRIATRMGYTLSMVVDGLNEAQHATFPFAVQVFPKQKPPTERLAAHLFGLYDPVGKTRQRLDELKIKYTLIKDGEDVPALSTYILGQGVLSTEITLPPAILTRVINEGATLLSFEQSTLDIFNLRVHPRGQRRVFPLVSAHPALAGLTVEDLQNWRGDQALQEPYPADRQETPSLYPEEFWKWGNRGVVTSYMIEKPMASPLLSIAECGFDLNYTPLAEIREGRGTILLCQMDVTGRYGVDPAATRLMENLLVYAASKKPLAAPSAMALSGKVADDEHLRAALPESPVGAPRIVFHSGPVTPENQKAFTALVAGGGTAFLIGAEALSDLGWLPVPVKRQEVSYARGAPAEDLGMGYGIGFSETFIKDRRTDRLPIEQAGVRLLTNPGFIAEVPYQQGRFILFAIDPEPYLHTDVTPERSQRIYGKLTRMLSILAANEGGQFKPLSSRYLAGITDARVDLPGQWKFEIDPDNKGARGKWQLPEFDDSAWRMLNVPDLWENQGVTNYNPRFPDSKRPYDGFAWYRCQVQIPASMADRDDLHLVLGIVDDMDVTYLNGERIGQTGTETPNAYSVPRSYPIPRGVIKPGAMNTIAVRVFDNLGGGGMTGPELYIGGVKKEFYPYLDSQPVFNPYKLTRW